MITMDDHDTTRTGRSATTADEGGLTMRAVVQHEYGGSEVLALAEVERPSPGRGEVLVRVRGAGLDRGTWHLMTGTPYAARLAIGLRRPRQPVPGRDVAGIVEAIGPDVTRFAVGDAVYGTGSGSFAELVVAKEKRLAPMPQGLSFEQAAVVPVSGQTALRAVIDVGRVGTGDRVLVIGASGGVGSYAVQIAVAQGAEVTGVCSAAKADLVRSLGAARVVDYATEDALAGEDSYDVIIDIAGNSSLKRLRHALAPKGTLVIVGGEDAGRWLGMGRQFRALALSPFVSQRLAMLVAKEEAAGVQRLTEMIEAGAIRPVVDRTFDLDDAPAAMRELEGGRVRGKVAIRI